VVPIGSHRTVGKRFGRTGLPMLVSVSKRRLKGAAKA
jgi:hypothetical protein